MKTIEFRKTTEGPWLHDEKGFWHDLGVPIYDVERTTLIAIACVTNDQQPDSPLSFEAEANANLIAAAPELYDALRYACHVFIKTSNAVPSDPNHWYNKAKKALRLIER